MTGAVLWYVHDHGGGHLARARAVLPKLRRRVVVATGPGVVEEARLVLDAPVVALPSDVPACPVPTTGPWHHAPACPEQRARGRALAAAIADHRCTTAVVDVSMEVSVLARLLGLRVITVRQSGRRDDDAHRIGLASADVVWVPQHPALEPVDGDVDERWSFTGAFSRFDGRPSATDGRQLPDRRTVVLLVGAGGTSLDATAWRAAAVPDGWRVVIAGTPERWQHGVVECVGRVDPLLPVLASADVVVTSAGWAAVADGVAAGVRLVLVAERRPFGEQVVRSEALAGAGLAVSLDRWPAPDELSDVLAAAARLRPDDWAPYYDGRGAERAAALVDERGAS